MKRTLGRSGIEVGALGMGCWAMGGPIRTSDTHELRGWGDVDDDESIQAIHWALDQGVNLFDTADCYGAGHSECVLGRALAGRRQQVVIASKFGNSFDEKTKVLGDAFVDRDYIRRCCERSLDRLRTDTIDLYQLHVGGLATDQVNPVLETLEQLVQEGKIRFYGWSTDNPEGPEFFARGTHCTAMQQRINIFEPSIEALRACERHNLASLNRGPLAMGILTGKFSHDSKMPDNDVRRHWDFADGLESRRLDILESLREILTSGGRTLAQGALGWLWAHSPIAIPIPGFKSLIQAKENIAAMNFGPLSEDQMRQIDQVLNQ